MIKKLCKSNFKDGDRQQIYRMTHTTNIKNQIFQNLSIFSLQRPKQVNISAIIATQPSQSENDGHSNQYFRNNRTNIRQLNNFLKHQGIVIKQKELIITNLPNKNRHECDIKQMRQKMLKILSLKSSIKKNLSQLNESPFPKINTIELPEIEGTLTKSPSIKIRKNTANIISNQSHLKLKQSVNKHSSLKNKKFELAFGKPNLGHQKQPLIIASSKKLSQLGLKQTNINKQQQQNQKIVNFHRFKNYSRLSKLSLRLATEFLPKNNSKGQHHISYSP